MRDFNAKVGSTMNENHLRATVGKYDIGGRNDRGEMFMEFCIENNLFDANTNFQHQKRRLYTWRSSDGKTLNQIDFMLVKTRWGTSVQDMKTYPGMNCNSDHNTLVAEVSLKMRRIEREQHHVNAQQLGENTNYAEEISDEIEDI